MYTWIENTFGIGDGLARGLAFAISLAVVLALFALFVFIVKRLAGGRVASVRSRQPRLAVMDAASIDTRRRLVLVRRDNVEHLLLIGGPADLVVEQGIVRGAPAGTALPRPQPVLQAVAGQVPVSENQAMPAAIPANFQPDDNKDDAPEQQGLAATRPVAPPAAEAKGAAAPTVPAPPPSEGETKSSAPSLRARLAELKKSAVPGSGKPVDEAQTAEPAPRKFFKKKTAAAVREQPKLPVSPSAAPTLRSGNSEPDNFQPSSSEPAISPAPRVDAVPAETGGARNTENVSELVRTLTAPKKIPSNEPVAPRRVTPPSSGPGAKATTAFHPETRKEPAPETDLPSSDAGTEAVVAPKIKPSATAASAPLTTNAAPEIPVAGNQTHNKTNTIAHGISASSPSKAEVTVPPVEPEAVTRTDRSAETQQSQLEANPQPAKTAPSGQTAEARVTDFAGRALAGTKTNSAPHLVKPADKPTVANDTSAMAEHNPIEDEMAKLLDEIHGTQKA